jgi:hypothetical protein
MDDIIILLFELGHYPWLSNLLSTISCYLLFSTLPGNKIHRFGSIILDLCQVFEKNFRQGITEIGRTQGREDFHAILFFASRLTCVNMVPTFVLLRFTSTVAKEDDGEGFIA